MCRVLATRWPLSHEHKKLLHAREFPSHVPPLLGYFTLPDNGKLLPVVRELRQEFSDEALLATDLFGQKPGRELHLRGRPGALVVLVRNFAGVVTQCVIKEKRGRERYEKIDGDRAAFDFHVPVHDEATDTNSVRVVIGLLRADFATVKTKLLTVGVSSTHTLSTLLEVMPAWGVQKVRLAFGSDVWSKPKRVKRVHEFAAGCYGLDIEVAVETWEGYDDLDDALRSGNEDQLVYLHGHAARKWIKAAVRRTAALELPKQLKVRLHRSPTEAVAQVLPLLQEHRRVFLHNAVPSHLVFREAGLDEGVIRPPRIEPIPPKLVGAYAAVRATFVQHDKFGVPTAVASLALQWPETKGFRRLASVVTTPVLVSDGSVLRRPGYDASTGLYVYSSLPDRVVVPETLTRAVAADALQKLREAFDGLSFATPADAAAWITTMLTPFAQPAIRGAVPVSVFVAERATARFLAQLLGEIAQGFTAREVRLEAGRLPQRTAADILANGDRLAVVRVVGRDELDLTTLQQRDRRTRQVAWHVAVESPSADLLVDPAALSIRLGTVPHEHGACLLKRLRDHRTALVSAALTLLRAGQVCPEAVVELPPWSPFDSWSRWVRAPLVWLGLPDPVETRTRPTRQERHVDPRIVLLDSIDAIARRERRGCTAEDLLSVVDGDEAQPPEKRAHGQLAAAIHTLLAGHRDDQDTRRLGMAISDLAKELERTPINGRRLARPRKRGNGSGNAWEVLDLNAASDTQQDDTSIPNS